MKVLLLLALFTTAQSVYSFYLNTNIGAKFNKTKVKFYVTSNSTCNNAGVSVSELLSIAEDAADKFWNRVPTANLKIEKGGTYSTTESLFLTGKLCVEGSSCNSSTDIPEVTQIVIACNSNTSDNFTADNIYALSAPNNLSGNYIAGSIILINDTSTTPFAGLSREEKVNVVGHELGHAIGIGHSNDKAALMYYSNLPHRDRLAEDDMDAMTYLYPNKLDSCTSVLSITNTGSSDDTSGPWNFLISSLFGVFLSLAMLKFGKIASLRHQQ